MSLINDPINPFFEYKVCYKMNSRAAFSIEFYEEQYIKAEFWIEIKGAFYNDITGLALINQIHF